jgi:hypothetical protein
MPINNPTDNSGELNGLQKKILRSLLISKSDQKSSVATLENRFAARLASAAKEQTEAFTGEIIALIAQRLAQGWDRGSLLELALELTEGFNYSFESGAALIDLYLASAGDKQVEKAASAKFGREDTDAIRALERQYYWIQRDASERAREKLKAIVESAFREGKTYEEVGAALRSEFGSMIDLTEAQFKTIGFTLARQNENVARAMRYIRQKVPYVRIIADMDSRTTPICRSLNGRIVPMAHIAAQLKAIISAESVSQAIAARDMSITTPIYGDLPANIGLPPYHFNCRTDISPYYLSNKSEPLDGSKEKREILGEYKRGEAIELLGRKKVVRFGAVSNDGHIRVVTDETYNHVNNSEKPPESKIHAALRSIIAEADNLDKEGFPNGRTIALSDNNIILILEGLEVITAFSRKTSKAAKDYFNNHSVLATRQKIKSRVFKWAKWILGR